MVAVADLLQAQEELDTSARIFRWNQALMAFLGLWPAKFNHFLFTLNFGYISYEMILEYLDLFLYIDNLEHVLINLTENVAYTQIWSNIFLLRVYNKELGEFISEAKKDFKATDYSEEERKTLISYHVKSKIFVVLLIVFTAATASLYYLKPILGQMSEIIAYVNGKENATIVFMLPYSFHTFYEMKDASTYFWTYASHFPFVFVSGFGQTSADCLMVTLVYHLAGQMAILAQRIEKISIDPSKCTEELYHIVRSHDKLLRMGKVLRDAFSAILLVHLFYATSLVCIIGYQIILCLAIGETAILAPFLVYIGVVLLILFAHCTVGESLLTESDRVAQAFYNCKWYEMTKEKNTIILLCIARSQKPLQLTAGKFAIYCLQTSTTCIKAAMGYLSVLRTVM